MKRYLTISTLAAALALGTLPLPAQEWHVSAQAGRLRSALDPAATSTESFAAGLRYDDAVTGFRLSAGVPRTSRDPRWGGVAAWRRLAVRHRGFVAGIDAQGSAFLAHDREPSPAPRIPGLLDPPLPPEPVANRSGHAVAGQLLPVVGYETARVQAHARLGTSRYSASFGATRLSRSVQLADVQLTLHPTRAVAIVPTARHFRAPNEQAATYIGASALTASKMGTLWAAAGAWTSGPTGESLSWATGARLRLHPRVTFDVTARRDVFDPLYMQPAQTSWSVGASVQIGRRPTAALAPVPAHYADGRATIRLKANGQSQVSIAGDFNGWKPAPMQRQGGDWTFTIALRPGVYHYSFVDADGDWFVPENVAGRRDDGMGGHVAVLVVQ